MKGANVPSSEDGPASDPPPPSRVLIVEDQAVVALELAERLTRQGHRVAGVVARGEELAARARELDPDLLLLDVRLMGEMDGIEAASTLTGARRPALIVITAHTDPSTVRRASELEPDAYLVKPFDDRLLGITVELALQRRRGRLARLDRRRAERRLAAMVEFSQDAIVGVDGAGRIGVFNRQAEVVFGYAAAEVLGDPLTLLIPDDQRAPHFGHFSRFSSDVAQGRHLGDRAQENIQGRRKNGEVFPAEIALGKVEFEGEIWFTAHVRDVTEKRRLEASALAGQKMAAVARLALGVAHDFNSLLSAIGCSAFLVRERVLDGDSLAGPLDDILQAVARGGALTRQLIGFAQPHAGKKVAIPLAPYVAQLRDLMRMMLKQGVLLTVDCEQDEGCVLVDPSRLEQIVMNLIDNARDAVGPSGAVTARVRRVDFEAPASSVGRDVPPGRYMVLEVSDDGTGIAPDVLGHIFDPFFTTKVEGRGTGLGLPTVLDIATSHGGFVQVETGVGVGSTFRVLFPRADCAEGHAGRDAKSGIVSASQALSVLVVEDDDGLRSSLSAILERAGHVVRSVCSAEEALADWDRGLRPALLLTDMALPGLDGLALAQRFLSLPHPPRVILMTGDPVETLGEPGALSVLAKPFNIRDLLALVEDRDPLRARRAC